MVAEQQDAAALELVALVQQTRPREHGLGRGLDVVEVGQWRGHMLEQRAHALQRAFLLQRRPNGQRATRGEDPLDLTQRHSGAGDDLRRLVPGERRDSADTAPIERGRLQQRFKLAQRRTVIRLVSVVVFLACLSRTVAV